MSIMAREGVASRWSKDPDAGAIFRAVMGTAPAEDYIPAVALLLAIHIQPVH
jgi:hypothetical protein